MRLFNDLSFVEAELRRAGGEVVLFSWIEPVLVLLTIKFGFILLLRSLLKSRELSSARRKMNVMRQRHARLPTLRYNNLFKVSSHSSCTVSSIGTACTLGIVANLIPGRRTANPYLRTPYHGQRVLCSVDGQKGQSGCLR